MKQLLNNWLKNSQPSKVSLAFSRFTHTVFAPNCILCDAKNDLKSTTKPTRERNDALQANIHAVCRACLGTLPFHPVSSCPQCGLSSNGQLCGSCISSPPDFDATKAVFLYEFPIDAMMLRYKYGNSLNLGDTFAAFLAEKANVEGCLHNIDLVIPMPMHPQRLKERGFNQALEIAKVFGKDKLDYQSVIRQTLTPPQASLPLKERVKNIKGAFKVDAKVKDNLTDKRVAIVDDVMTTGASLNELANTLKKAGAAHVECWVIARTLPHK